MECISDKCSFESCRFNHAGQCTDQEQRDRCLEMFLQVVPGRDDRLVIADIVSKDNN